MVSNKSINLSKMNTAGITKIVFRKSIENNIENLLLLLLIKLYVLAFNSMFKCIYVISRRLQEMEGPWKVTKLMKDKG